MFAFFGLSQCFDQGSSAFFSCTLNVNVIRLLFFDCECNTPSFLATVFQWVPFNGDLNKWNVAKVTNMGGSTSLRILKNDLT
jgi:hypothetical protein